MNVLKPLNPLTSTTFRFVVDRGIQPIADLKRYANSKKRLSIRYTQPPPHEITQRKFDAAYATFGEFAKGCSERNITMNDLMASANLMGFFVADAMEMSSFVRQIPLIFSNSMPEQTISICFVAEKTLFSLTRYGYDESSTFWFNFKRWGSGSEPSDQWQYRILLVREHSP